MLDLDVPALLFHHKVSVSHLESTLHGENNASDLQTWGERVYTPNNSFQESLFRFGIHVNATG